jgi:hypothetical protein
MILGQAGKNPHAQALGLLGGAKGGYARAAKLSPERRTEIARDAVQTRWARVRMGVSMGGDAPEKTESSAEGLGPRASLD